MDDKLLVIVVTRDWAERGSRTDEFCADWLQGRDQEFAWLPRQSLDVLLVHGYRGRFRNATDVCNAIASHASEYAAAQSYRGCVVLQHSSQFPIQDGCKVAEDLWVGVVRAYGTARRLVQEALDDAIAELQEISEATKGCWCEEFKKITPAVARDRMAELIHTIIHLFLPLEVDFSGLREAPNDESRIAYAAEVLRTRTGDTYEVRLRKLRFLVAQVGEVIGLDQDELLPDGQCFLRLVRACRVSFKDESVSRLVSLCGLADQGGEFEPPESQRYYAPRPGEQDPVGSFFHNLDKAQEAQALIRQCGEKVQDKLDFLDWFKELRRVLEEIHEKTLSGARVDGGEG